MKIANGKAIWALAGAGAGLVLFLPCAVVAGSSDKRDSLPMVFLFPWYEFMNTMRLWMWSEGRLAGVLFRGLGPALTIVAFGQWSVYCVVLAAALRRGRSRVLFVAAVLLLVHLAGVSLAWAVWSRHLP